MRKLKNTQKVLVWISFLVLLLLITILSVRGYSGIPQAPLSNHWSPTRAYTKFLFNNPVLSVFGVSTVQPNTLVNYNVSLKAIGDYDGDYGDGSYMVRYGNWAVIDKDQNIIEQGSWEEVEDWYNKSVSFTSPNNPGSYALLIVITENDASYTNDEWVWNGEVVNNKEAYKFNVRAPNPINVPSPKGFIAWLQNIWDWFKGLIGW